MPAEVIATIHQLAAACKRYKGIVFMDKDGNIINDNNDEDDNTLEITGVDMTATETDINTSNIVETTGVNTTNTRETTGVENNNNYTEHTTGVGNNITVHNNEHLIAPDTDNEPNITRDSQNE